MRRTSLFLLVFINLAPLLAQQGNYKYNQYGNRSILLTGNVTGSVSDIGLTYYNPAKLSDIEIDGFAFNARAYQLNSLKIDPLITDGNAISNTSFTGVPSLAGGTFNLFDEKFAYVFLSKYRINTDLSTNYNELNQSIIEQFPQSEALSLSANIANDIREDWYGLSWAHKVNKQLSLGISLFGVYYKYKGRRSTNKTFQYEENKVATDLIEYRFEQKSYGLNLKVGASYKIDNVDLGLNATLPYVQLIGSGSYRVKIISSGTTDGSDRFYDYRFNDVSSNRRVPFGVSAGAGIRLKKSRIHLNIDYMSHLNEYQRLDIPEVDLGEDLPSQIVFNEKRRNVFNVGIGGELFISDTFKTFFGLSTDFDSLQDETTFFDFTTTNADEFSAGSNYYHISGGVDWTLKWANLILGLTYSQGANSISLDSNIVEREPLIERSNSTEVINRRLQLVLGFEIPFLDSEMRSLRNKVKVN
jgi:long-subunit fatty acid transport protein